MGWNYWVNRKVFVQLKKGDCYTGIVIEYLEEGFLVMIDKYNEHVALAVSEIKKITENNNYGKGN